MKRSLLGLASIALACALPAQVAVSTANAVASAAQGATQATNLGTGVQIGSTSQVLFTSMAKAFGSVKLDALRTWTDYAGKKPVEVTERVRVAPGKGFLLDLVNIREAGSPHLDPKLQWRSLRYPQNAGYFYYFRDFRVHDPVRATRNYVARPMGRIQRGPRTLAIYDILPQIRNRCSYRILVDVATGLCLDRIEFDASGRVTSTLFYDVTLLRIGNAADKGLKDVREWWKPWMIVRDFQQIDNAVKTLTFTPRIPKLVDTGFELNSIRTTRTDRQSDPYLVLIYDDGVATRILAQNKVHPSEKWPVKFTAKSAGDVPVLNYRLGPHAQFLTRYQGTQYLVVGSFPDAGIPPLLDNLMR